jgi:hypothetical protein
MNTEKESKSERTCGSVRSSLAAPAGLVTTRLEAAVTTRIRSGERGGFREDTSRSPMPDGLNSRLVVSLTEVNCNQAPLSPESQKALSGSGQNRRAVGCLVDATGHTDRKTAGVVQRLTHRKFHDVDRSNPSSRPVFRAGFAARRAVGMPGRGGRRKQMPSCNGTDRDQCPAARAGRLPTGGSLRNPGRIDTGGNSK